MRLSPAAIAALAMAAGALLAHPASAHHSFAMFDMNKRTTIEGTVKEFQLINPHSFIIVNIKDASGKDAEWWIETGHAVGLKRQGFTRTTIKPGDKASLIINPLRDGRPGGNLQQATINGQVVGRRAAAPQATTGPGS